MPDTLKQEQQRPCLRVAPNAVNYCNEISKQTVLTKAVTLVFVLVKSGFVFIRTNFFSVMFPFLTAVFFNRGRSENYHSRIIVPQTKAQENIGVIDNVH